MSVNYYHNAVYKALHSKMYIVTSYSQELDSVNYELHLYDCSSSSFFSTYPDVSVSLTANAAQDFASFKMDPSVLINLFSYLCILSGKKITSITDK